MLIWFMGSMSAAADFSAVPKLLSDAVTISCLPCARASWDYPLHACITLMLASLSMYLSPGWKMLFKHALSGRF